MEEEGGYCYRTPASHALKLLVLSFELVLQGTYGVVFKAKNSRTKETVALKQVGGYAPIFSRKLCLKECLVFTSLPPSLPPSLPFLTGETPHRHRSQGGLLCQRSQGDQHLACPASPQYRGGARDGCGQQSR